MDDHSSACFSAKAWCSEAITSVSGIGSFCAATPEESCIATCWRASASKKPCAIACPAARIACMPGGTCLPVESDIPFS